MTERSFPIDRLRNIGLIAHIDAGKTTTTERILYYTGRTHRLGSVDEGTTVTDWMDQERERGITIVSAAVSAAWREHRINLIDTPGHIDFTAEVQRVLRVLDGAVVVFDALHGVQPQSETVWRQADQYRIPRICFINKMDRIGADFDHAVRTLRERLGANPVPLQVPLGFEAGFRGVIDLLTLQAVQWVDEPGAKREYSEVPAELRASAEHARAQLVEHVAEEDDELAVCYLEGVEPGLDELKAALRRGTLSGRIVPVLCGSALKNRGVQPVLDAVVDFLPSPLDVGAVGGFDPRDQGPLTRQVAAEERLAALVFKTVTDPYAGRLGYVRVYSGELHAGLLVYNARTYRRERVGRLVRMYADRREEIKVVTSGDIAAIVGARGLVTGDSLSDPEQPILLEPIQFPEPVINVSIVPRTAEDESRLAGALHDLEDDDPTFRTLVDDQTGQIVLSGMGELHLDVLIDQLKREQGIAVVPGKPRVNYKETITKAVPRAEGRFVRQTGGHGHYGHVVLAMEPAPAGTGIAFENLITGGAIPREFIPAVEDGVREAALSGALEGNPVTDIRVRLVDGSYHEVDSSAPTFKVAAVYAFQRGLEQGGSVFLEPVCRIEVTTPEDCLGGVLSQLSASRVEIEGVDSRSGNMKAVRGMAPLSEMFGYATQLRSATHGRGSFVMEFDHYAPAPRR